ncbi:ABC-type amino acid transport/signal transduction system, periplasmic component/domain [Nitrincola lacisaponensis]|uniref:ABC-type amino acid transport/signal transduction system, periplasmic component/domain n=1 Tax=Nitrincola lacisaponensis TaxID=267850 RepID=A0A063Y1H4_9GAMM|nr:transporter substrate-binding domain-containing protein [Nitrincola lacisaponensis]KDE40178.1 ABC-type amino acid transport/signal transduction system, periplasmic component/domain [Nitrincola lacisaponensis]
MKTTFNTLKRGLLASIAAVGVTLSLSAQANLLSEIEDRGVIRVAVPQDFPPFGSVGTDLQPRGYDIDMANYIGEQLGVSVELITVTSANRIPYLQTGRADLVISSLGKNEERERAIDFSNAYAPFFLGVFGNSDIEVSSPEDLSGHTVGVTRGAVEDMELEKVLPADAMLQRFEDNNTTLSAYLSGQVQLIATGNLVATEIAERRPNQAPVTKFMLRDSPCYIGLKKGEAELQARVNEIIAQALEDGTLNRISETWLRAPLPEGFGS